MARQVSKLTISLPRSLVALADEIADERGISRSKLVSICLQELMERRLRTEMEKGYKAMANENLRFARESIDLATEVLSEWK